MFHCGWKVNRPTIRAVHLPFQSAILNQRSCSSSVRMEKKMNKFRGWLPRKPMKFDSDTLPDLEENESFTAPFSRSRIHQ